MSVLKMSDYAKQLKKQGKLQERYHVIGKHGGAWIYETTSHEELDRLLAMAPVYNYASYEVLPLAEMDEEPTIVGKGKKKK
jgi:muconolactone delta-isomerase